MKTIELRSVTPKVFAGSELHSDVWQQCLTLERGNRYLVTAESGAGKSSFCAFLYGNRADFEGEIFFDGRNIRELSIHEWSRIRREVLSYLPQELMLFSELTALENVELKNKLTGFRTEAQVAAMFERLGICDKLHQPVGKLSIGQQQRVAIIRALCQPCDFFILDEPVSHLDENNNAIVAAMIGEAAAECGAGVISTSVGNHLSITVDNVLRL